jgi:hypothetical protein
MAWRGLEVLGLLQNGPKSRRDIVEALGVTYDAARDVCKRLAARGLVNTSAGLNQITEAGAQALAGGAEVVSGPAKGGCVERYKGSTRAKAWRVLRIRRKADLEDLLPLVLDAEATKKDEAKARRNLECYLRALTLAGFLHELPRRGGAVRWLLVSDTGPCAPAWNKAQRTVTDANTGEVHALPKAKEAASHD